MSFYHLTGTRMVEEASFQGQLLDSFKFELTVAGSLRGSTKL
jgi:hypothetical protein